MPSVLPLEGLYLRLVAAGIPISVRDYQDALVALRAGYGVHSRDELRWLCETLWARTEEEVMLLARLFRDLPRLSPENIDALTGAVLPNDPAPRPRSKATRKRRSGSDATPQAEMPAPAPAIEFGTPSESGVGLPRVQVPARTYNTFILAPRPLVTLRSLIIAWRRFRLSQRFGAKVELDIAGTVAEQCRRGTLVEPVLVPARRNQARLVVLVDSSPSMVVWKQTTKLLVESLDASLFAEAAGYYFDNSPDDVLFEGEALTRPVAIATVLERHPRSALLIVSDAGAARGKRNQERIRQLHGFIEGTKTAWQPAVWLNPMRRDRWKGCTAESVARFIGMFELSDDGVVAAVDYLRGKDTGGVAHA